MEKISVCFYHPDKSFPDVDCRNLHLGNPGIGGSDYALLMVAEKLALVSDRLKVYIATQSKNEKIPQSEGALIRLYASNKEELLFHLLDKGISVVVFRHGVICPNDDFYKKIEGKTKIVIWCENSVSFRDLNNYSKMKSIGRLIAVTKEQMDLYIDHSAYKKSDYIYNALPHELINESKKQIVNYFQRPNNVVYMGSLVPEKSFHVLAKAWPEVVNKVPDANLYVIGSGQLYSREQKLGKYGVAEERYEDSFIKYLTDYNGNILKSVHFLGVLGNEKNNIMRNAKVAVPNPTGRTETFCISGIEMQLSGCLITTLLMSAYLDTINPKYSILYNNTNQLAESIVSLLCRRYNHDINDEISFVEQKFDLDKIVKEWEQLFTVCLWDNSHLHPFVMTNPNYKYKWIRNLYRQFKTSIPFGFSLFPSVLFLQAVVRRLFIRNIQDMQ